MYVYYETHKYCSGSKGFISVSFYTHRITVFENCSERVRELLIAKYGHKAVSKLTWDGRIYVRETMRIARHNRYLPSHPYYKRAEFTDRAVSSNYGLSIFARVTKEDQLVCKELRRYTFDDA